MDNDGNNGKKPDVEKTAGEEKGKDAENGEPEWSECGTSSVDSQTHDTDYDSDETELNDVGTDQAKYEARQLAYEAHSVPLLKAGFRPGNESFRDALLRFNFVFKSRFPRSSVNFFLGELCDAVQEAFQTGGSTNEASASSSTSNPSPLSSITFLAIYLHCDRAVACNLFPERMFSDQLVTELLTNNGVLWGWDVSTDSNYDLLGQQMREAGLVAVWEAVLGVEFEHYPLLIIVRRAGGPPAFLLQGDATCEEAVEALLTATDSAARPAGAEVEKQIAQDEALARQMWGEVQITESAERVRLWKDTIPKSYPPAASLPGTVLTRKGVPVDDRHMVREGVANPLPPRGPTTPIVAFKQLQLCSPIAGIYSLYFHPTQISFAGPADPQFHFTVPYTNILRIYFLRHPFHRKTAYFLLRLHHPNPTSEQTGNFINYVLIEIQHAEVALDFNVDACQSVLPLDFLDALSSGELTTVGNVFDRLADVLQLLSRRPLTVSHSFISSLGRPMVQCSSVGTAGFLYPLESGLAFVSVAPICADFTEIVCVETNVPHLGDSEFDLTIVTRTNGERIELFRIPTCERSGILDFLQEKRVKVRVVEARGGN